MRSLILRMVGGLLVLALCAGGATAQTTKKKKRTATKTAAAKGSKSGAATMKRPAQPYTGDPIPPPQPPEQGDGVRRITAAEARAALDKGTAIIVDVRNDGAYKMGHVKGAMLIPFPEIGARINQLPRDKMIITYCS